MVWRERRDRGSDGLEIGGGGTLKEWKFALSSGPGPAPWPAYFGDNNGVKAGSTPSSAPSSDVSSKGWNTAHCPAPASSASAS